MYNKLLMLGIEEVLKRSEELLKNQQMILEKLDTKKEQQKEITVHVKNTTQDYQLKRLKFYP